MRFYISSHTWRKMSRKIKKIAIVKMHCGGDEGEMK